MAEVHLVVGVAVVVSNLIARVMGGVEWIRNRPSIPFWYLLRTSQTIVFIQVLLGALLVVTVHEAADNLHYLYGILPLPVSLLAEAARAGAAQQEIGDLDFEALPEQRQRGIAFAIVRREMGIMAVSCLVILFLALRAAGTS